MSLTLQTPITTARTILNDILMTTYPDADLLRYANDALDAIVTLAPRYYYETGTLACVAGEALQSISFADALSLVSVDRVVGGGVVTPTDRATLSAFAPGWMSETTGAAIHWFPLDDSKTRFYVYPPAPPSQTLSVTYVRIPCEYAITDETTLPATLSGAITDYIVYVALTRQDEYASQERAAGFMASFVARLSEKA